MRLGIDHNRFFRKLTLQIAGCVELDLALQRCLETLADIMPVDMMVFLHYQPQSGRLTALAAANRQGARQLGRQIVVSDAIRQQIHRRWPTRVWRISRLGSDPATADAAAMLQADDAAAMLMDLTLEAELTGIVAVANHQGHHYDRQQAELLTSLNEPLALALANGMRFQELSRMRDLLAEDNRLLKDELSRSSARPVVGSDRGLKTVMEQVVRVAGLDSPVLLLGETGTGKEVIARAIHDASSRRKNPFIAVNCGALAPALSDSELFGHEKGAFTGAQRRHLGRFERAHGGTLFLDEIGELPPEIQVRLLRVLQEKEMERVGGSQPVTVDPRIIVATHRNLEERVQKGRFRQDLYFRIRVFPIQIPPLRQRRQDIEPLLRHFVHTKALAMNKLPIPEVSPAGNQWLFDYAWPGNVRELENLVERALILHTGGPLVIQPMDCVAAPDQSPPAAAHARPAPLDQVMADHIRRALEYAGGRVEGRDGAAELLALHPSTLRQRMRKLGIAFGRKRHSR